MLELKRGFTPKDDKEHKTVFTVKFGDAEDFITYMVSKFGDDKVAEYLWEGYSIKSINAGARQVEGKKGNPLPYIENRMREDFPDKSTVTHDVEKATTSEYEKAFKALSKEEQARIIAKYKETHQPTIEVYDAKGQKIAIT